MNRASIIVGLAALVVLGVAGYLLFARTEAPPAPVTARIAPQQAPGTAQPPSPAPRPEAGEAEPEAAPAPRLEHADPESASLPEAEPRARPQSARIGQEPEPQAAPGIGTAPAQPMVKPRQAAPQAVPGPGSDAASLVPPSFDVVRVERTGETVVAGRAMPGSAVTLLDGGRRAFKVTANGNGQWVMVLRTPLAPGSHELGLESVLVSGEVLLSENVVVVSVPEPAPAQVAAAPSAAPQAAQGVMAEARNAGPEAAAAAASALPAEVPPAAALPVEAQPVEVPPTKASPAEAQPVETAPVEAARVTPSQALGAAAATDEGQGQAERPLAVLMPRTGQGPIRVLQAPEPAPTGLSENALLLQTVDYDGDGFAIIGGRAPAGAALIVYMDDRPVGRVAAGSGGLWRVTLQRQVSYGVHRLRVDQIGTDGKVVARVESPFSRATMVAALPDERAVIVQPGNSLWRIARRVYGEGMRFAVIYDANKSQIRDADLIYPGQIFVIPPDRPTQ